MVNKKKYMRPYLKNSRLYLGCGNHNEKPHMKNNRLYLGETVKQKGGFLPIGKFVAGLLPIIPKYFGGRKKRTRKKCEL